MLRKRIFIDHQLRIGDDFDAGLVQRVQSSAALPLVLSHHYVESAWCGKELDLFVRARSDDVADPQNIFVVELSPLRAAGGTSRHRGFALPGSVPRSPSPRRVSCSELMLGVESGTCGFLRNPQSENSPVRVTGKTGTALA